MKYVTIDNSVKSKFAVILNEVRMFIIRFLTERISYNYRRDSSLLRCLRLCPAFDGKTASISP